MKKIMIMVLLFMVVIAQGQGVDISKRSDSMLSTCGTPSFAILAGNVMSMDSVAWHPKKKVQVVKKRQAYKPHSLTIDYPPYYMFTYDTIRCLWDVNKRKVIKKKKKIIRGTNYGSISDDSDLSNVKKKHLRLDTANIHSLDLPITRAITGTVSNNTLHWIMPENHFDTIKCILLVNYPSGNTNFLAYTMKGYEVRYCSLTDNYGSHFKYLDDNRKELDSNLVIWMSKRVDNKLIN